ncbi:MAG: Ig-like domain-containing protein [Oscillospiraceae bacterium]|nr:Ig-like domain-containing protein [Oscillospiraceae bacterium]
MKKLLSVILAITMIISLIPAATAAGETDATENLKIVYDIGAQMATYHPVNDSESLTYTTTNNFWEYVAHRNASQEARIRNYTADNISYLRLYHTRTWYAIKINVPVTGSYVPTLNIYENMTAVVSNNVYLIPATTKLENDKDYQITGFADLGELILSTGDRSANAATNQIYTYSGNVQSIKAGEYIVAIIHSSNGANYTPIVNFTLTSGTGETAPMIKSYSEPTDIAIGGETSTKIETSAVLTDAVTASDAVITYSSTDDKIASVDADGKVTGLKNGTVTITAKATSPSKGTYVTKTKEIKVGTGVADIEPDGITVNYDFAVMNPEGTTLSDLTYSVTNGFWQYADNERNVASINSETSGLYISVYEQAPLVRSDGAKWFAVKLNVPKKDTYNIKLDCEATNASGCNVIPKLYLFKADGSVEDGIIADNMLSTTEVIPARTRKEISFDAEALEEGEYYLVMCSSGDTAEKYPRLAFYNLTLKSGTNGLGKVPMFSSSNGKTALEAGETSYISLTATHYSNGDSYSDAPATTYKSDNEAVATVNTSGAITAIGRGTANISATSGEKTKTVSITVKDKRISDNVSFMVTSALPNAVSANYVGSGNVVGESVAAYDVVSIPGNTVIKVTAADVPGYVFRGWIRGGTAEKGTFLRTEPDFNIRLVSNLCLTAVYDELEPVDSDSVTVEFYNENGQFISDVSVAKETPFASVSKPDMKNYSLTGYNFLHWSITKDEAIADNHIFDRLTRVVAQYEVEDTEYLVDVPEGLGFEDGKYVYNTPVTLNAGKEVAWTRNGKTVAFGDTYSYFVWDKEEISYSEDVSEKAPTIVLDATKKADGAVMIEWDAAGASVVEVGIVYTNIGGKADVTSFTGKAVSKSKENHGQFAAIGEGTARGYLAYKDGSQTRVVYTD